MNDLFRKLLDLRTLDWADQSVRFGFERPLPAWGWITVIGIAVFVAVWSYQRLIGRKRPRILLGVVRAALLALLVVLLCGPQLVQRNESVERDWVLVLADRSASMGIEDAPTNGNATQSRDQQLRDMIQKSWPMWTELAAERTIVWLGFAGGAFDITAPGAEPGQPPALNLTQPDGRRTSLGAALDQALARAVARPISGIVVISDGRSIDQPSRAAMRRLETDLIPVHAVTLGSPDAVGDVAIRRVDAPRTAFAGDITPIRVELERTGSLANAGGASVRLVDTATGRVLDEQRITFDAPTSAEGAPAATSSRSVTLTHLTDQPGNVKWAVQVESDAKDLIAGNNQGEVSIELVDRPMRVLYIDGYPRWEQRYLRNLLIREKSVNCSTLMLAPDRRFTQEGDIEVDALPDSPERWAEFDAVILGDVSPDVFTFDQLSQLRDHISQRGAGLLWIGGPSSTPSAWFDTPLADLLPFTKDAIDTATLADYTLMSASPAAERLGILRLGDSPEQPWPTELADPQVGWSQLRWVQAISRGGLKPTAEILASAISINNPSASDPLLLSMRYGGGRSLYLATDEIWRWRYARGEVLYERFWLQLIRMLARESLSRGGAPALLEVEPTRATVDQPVQIRVELLDQSVADMGLSSITVEVQRPAQPGESQPTSIEMALRPDQGNSRSFTGLWIPPEAGRWSVRPTESSLTPYRLSRDVEVALPDDELRAPETDHPLLARLASETGGKVYTPDQIGDLAQSLPNRQVRLVNEVTESLWDTPLALILAVFLLTLEWVGRRVVQLL